MRAKLHLWRWAAPLSLAIVLSAPAQSRADDASPWDKDTKSAVRLIAGSTLRDKNATALRAGIELQLEPGWKTYWRYAGDSGLPPQFEFAGSDNVKSAMVLWPAPTRFPDGAGGNSIGYTGNVIFPVHVAAQDPAKPVTLRLQASYGVCEKICIPASGKAELLLAGGPASQDASLAAAEARAPKPVVLGAVGPLAIHGAHRDTVDGRSKVVVEVTAPEGASVNLFVEGLTSQWSLPLPEPVGKPAGTARSFAFDVDGVPPGARIEGAWLKLTLVAGEEAIEVVTHAD